MSEGNVRVFNIRGDKELAPESREVVIRGDRTNKILGNPHPMKNQTREERVRVIEAFRVDMAQDIAKHGPISQEINRLAKLVDEGAEVAIGCWCKPLPCHIDLVAEQVRARAAALRAVRERGNQNDVDELAKLDGNIVARGLEAGKEEKEGTKPAPSRRV